MALILALTTPPLSELLIVCLVILLIGALFTVLKPYVAEPFRTIVLVIAAFGLVIYTLKLFGVI